MGDNCSCIYVGDGFDGPYFLSEKTRTARKKHKCYECQRDIQIGETYEVANGRWDTKIETYKTCNDCLSLRKAFFCNGYIFGSILEDVMYHIEEMSCNISSDCITKLTPTARKWVCEKIEECWERYYDNE